MAVQKDNEDSMKLSTKKHMQEETAKIIWVHNENVGPGKHNIHKT